jgi:hypothetical protein
MFTIKLRALSPSYPPIGVLQFYQSQRIHPMKLPFSQRDMHMVKFQWVPWCFNWNARCGYLQAYIALPGEHYLGVGLGVDDSERVAGRLGPLLLTRPETREEEEDRLEGYEEEAFMAHELNRYTEWAY